MENIEQLEVKTVINYNWWEVGTEGVFKEHYEKLKEVADEHISTMMLKGFTSGELPTQRYASFDALYTGFWEVKREIK